MKQKIFTLLVLLIFSVCISAGAQDSGDKEIVTEKIHTSLLKYQERLQ